MSFRADLDPRRIPRHVAIVMDGNGRWAKERGLPRSKGHEAGERALYDVVEGALEIGLPHLSVYAFSTENWSRPKSEVAFLMNFNRKQIRRRREQLHDRGVRIRFVGRRDWRLPRSVLREMEEAERLTRADHRLTLHVALNYGGRTEIVDAVKRLIAEHDAGRLRGERISPESLSRRMYDPSVPDPDLVIRTSGEMRISNFLIWQAAYAELWFTPVLWPDFSREHLFEAIRDYQKRDRRFGGLGGRPVIKYFAYGSNMDPRTMAEACPEASPLGAARLDGYRLEFNVYSDRWEGGAANIEPDPDAHVWGVVWEVSEEELAALDTFSGHPTFFRQERVVVGTTDGSVEAVTYRVAHQKGYVRPTDPYINRIRAAIRMQGLPVEAADILEHAARPPSPRIST